MDKVKKFFGNKLAVAILSIALGVVFIVLRQDVISVGIVILGIVLLIAAVIFFITYFTSKMTPKPTQNIIFAIISAIIGILLLVNPPFIGAFAFIVIGIILIIVGVLDLIEAFKTSGPSKGLSIIAAILLIVLGIIMFFNPVAFMWLITVFIGIALLVNGVVMLVASASQGPTASEG